MELIALLINPELVVVPGAPRKGSCFTVVTVPFSFTHTYNLTTPLSCTPPDGGFILASKPPINPTTGPLVGPLPVPVPNLPFPPLPFGSPPGVPSGLPLYPPLRVSSPAPLPDLSFPIFILGALLVGAGSSGLVGSVLGVCSVGVVLGLL